MYLLQEYNYVAIYVHSTELKLEFGTHVLSDRNLKSHAYKLAIDTVTGVASMLIA